MPSSNAARVYGQQGNRWLPEVADDAETYGDAYQCGTCKQKLPTVAIATDPQRPKSGAWHVCGRCREAGKRLRSGLTYTPIERGAS